MCQIKFEFLIATVSNLLGHLISVNAIKMYEFRGPRFSRILWGLLVGCFRDILLSICAYEFLFNLLGLLVGGLIGHFATKANTDSNGDDGSDTGARTGGDTTAAPTKNPNQKDEERYKQNREFLFSISEPNRMRETERWVWDCAKQARPITV